MALHKHKPGVRGGGHPGVLTAALPAAFSAVAPDAQAPWATDRGARERGGGSGTGQCAKCGKCGQLRLNRHVLRVRERTRQRLVSVSVSSVSASEYQRAAFCFFWGGVRCMRTITTRTNHCLWLLFRGCCGSFSSSRFKSYYCAYIHTHYCAFSLLRIYTHTHMHIHIINII